MRKSLVAVAAALVVIPCVTHAQSPRVRDSVGIRIVENASRLKAPVVFTLGTKPNVDVGGLDADPESELRSRTGYPRVIRLNDGRVAVLDVTRVQYFDANGKRLRITGRSGGGPGEFVNPVSLCRIRGDTVFVSDGQARRLAVLDRTGEFVSQISFPGRASAESAFCLEDGSFIVAENQPQTTKGENVLRVTRLGRHGEVINRVTDINTGIFDMLISRETSIIARGSSVYVGDGLTYEVREYSSAGKLQSIIRTDDKLEPVSRGELEKLPTKVYRPGATAAEQRASAQRAAAASRTKTWPAYGRVLADLNGRIWIQDWAAVENRDPDGWTAFDATGKLLGRLVIHAPASKEKATRVVQFGKDEVFVTRTDDDGALHYTAYPLVPRN